MQGSPLPVVPGLGSPRSTLPALLKTQQRRTARYVTLPKWRQELLQRRGKWQQPQNQRRRDEKVLLCLLFMCKPIQFCPSEIFSRGKIGSLIQDKSQPPPRCPTQEISGNLKIERIFNHHHPQPPTPPKKKKKNQRHFLCVYFWRKTTSGIYRMCVHWLYLVDVCVFIVLHLHMILNINCIWDVSLHSYKRICSLSAVVYCDAWYSIGQ